MASTADFRNGFTFIESGDLFTIIEFQHVKPGKGGAFIRTKLRNIKTKTVFERTYRSGERFDEVKLERRPYEFLYHDGDSFVFMDTETYDQINVDENLLGDSKGFLAENMTCNILFHGETPIEVELPTFVELGIIQTEPGFKGNTAQNVTKPSIVSTGAEVYVPPFIEIGDIIKIDTRTGAYIERVKK
ncbi:MAG: elongation factor P [Candidatus Latescibacterota bacterium]